MASGSDSALGPFSPHDPLVHPAKNMGESSVVRRRRATCASETKLSILRHRPNQLIVSPLSAAVTLAVGLSTFVCAEKNRLEQQIERP